MLLREDVFIPVAIRIKARSDSLQEFRRFWAAGIEGWFKVEVVAALGEKVKALQNKGPDLLLKDDIEMELKAATDFHLGWFKKYSGIPVLFIAGGAMNLDEDSKETQKRLEKLKGVGEIIGLEFFGDGRNTWIIGMVIPS